MSDNINFSYYLPDNGDNIDNAEQLEAYSPMSWDDMAKYAAEHEYDNGDGWVIWPTVIAIVCGGEERRFSVDLEHTPIFHVKEIEQETET